MPLFFYALFLSHEPWYTEVGCKRLCKEVCPIKKQIFEEIISLIDSKMMKEHLLANQPELSIRDFLHIVAGAPVGLGRKRELLVRLENATQDEEEKEDVAGCVAYLDNAMNKLSQFAPSQSALVVVNMYCDAEKELPTYQPDGFFPAASYEGARLAIQRYNDFEMDEEQEPEQTLPWYWKLELYDYQKDGTAILTYTYICSNDGEVQYFYAVDKSKRGLIDKRFFGQYIQDLNLPVPYIPGDILYVDCRPYTWPAYCLITEVGADCCGVQCVYRKKDGSINTGAFKHGHYFEDAYDMPQYLSPLYRAKVFDGELPAEYSFMKKLSQKLKEDPQYGKALFKELHNGGTISQ